MRALPAFAVTISLHFGYRRPLYLGECLSYAGNPWPVQDPHKIPVRGSGILESSDRTGNCRKRQMQNQDIRGEIRRYGIPNCPDFAQEFVLFRRTGTVNKKSAGIFLSCAALFPFYRCGWFTADVIHDTVDPFHLVDNVV